MKIFRRSFDSSFLLKIFARRREVCGPRRENQRDMGSQEKGLLAFVPPPSQVVVYIIHDLLLLQDIFLFSIRKNLIEPPGILELPLRYDPDAPCGAGK